MKNSSREVAAVQHENQALKDWKADALAGSLTHGVVAPGAWSTDIGTALGLFLQSKSVPKFQAALVAAAKKNAK